MAENECVVKPNELPMSFQVKYMGFVPARGLWGIKHTRKPVDQLVSDVKGLPPGKYIPRVKIVVTTEGINMIWLKTQSTERTSHRSGGESAQKYVISEYDETDKIRIFPIATISYGVQDLVYTRVFSMIVVKELDNVLIKNPFECHAFVCESRAEARRLTYALAAAFHEYSANISEQEKKDGKKMKMKFAIDLRTPEELANEEEDETEA